MPYLVLNICKHTRPNAETLTALLENNPNSIGFEFCDLSQKDTLNGYKSKIKDADVYVVGHGEVTKEAFVDENNKDIINIDKIINWCVDNGATRLIDTCCYPKQRLAKVKALSKSIPYHCKKDLEQPVTPGINKNDTVSGFLKIQGIEQTYP
ncbi:hypothetical protein [Methylomonas sp. AM2-LC]|uniref:hypothetical protein n=1 Tax=Methylomonas sp. AM2-LC TaxID=3153301 RepID=UPI003267995A